MIFERLPESNVAEPRGQTTGTPDPLVHPGAGKPGSLPGAAPQMIEGEARSVKPPADPYDTAAWEKFYRENPAAKRSVGSAQADDPAAFKTQSQANVSTDIGAAHDVVSTVNPDRTVRVTYGEKSTTISLHEQSGSNKKLAQELGISRLQATQVLQDVRGAVGRPPRTFISFAQGKGDPKEYLKKALRDPKGQWESDAFGRPPGEATRHEARVPMAEGGRTRLADYAYVFEELEPGQFTAKTSKTTTVTEYQYVDPATKLRVSGAKVRPIAVVRVDESGMIVEIVDHVMPGPPAKARVKLVELFDKLGWKVSESLREVPSGQ